MVAGLSALVSIALAIQGEGLPWQGGRAREGEGLVPEERGWQHADYTYSITNLG